MAFNLAALGFGFYLVKNSRMMLEPLLFSNNLRVNPFLGLGDSSSLLVPVKSSNYAGKITFRLVLYKEPQCGKVTTSQALGKYSLSNPHFSPEIGINPPACS